MSKQSVEPAPQDEEFEPEYRDLTPHQAGALVAKASQTGDPARVAEARRNLAEAHIAASIKKALENAPKLTNGQIVRLTTLLRKTGERQTGGIRR